MTATSKDEPVGGVDAFSRACWGGSCSMTPIRTPRRSSPTRPSQGLQEEQARLFEVADEGVREHRPVVAVNDAVVEAEAEVHAPSDLDLSVAHHGGLLHLVDAHDGDLGIVQDGCRKKAPELAEARDGERRPRELLAGGLPLAGA